jgi:hypothetical protein
MAGGTFGLYTPQSIPRSISKKLVWPVAHPCNPSYSGGRDQEDHSSKPAQANSSTRPYLKKPFTKIRLVEWLKVKALSSNPSAKKKKKKKGKRRS